MINQNNMTAVEKIILEIDNELQTLESLHGSEIMGRKIGLAFAKRIAEQAKEIEKEQIMSAFEAAEKDCGKDFLHGDLYYNEIFKSE